MPRCFRKRIYLGICIDEMVDDFNPSLEEIEILSDQKFLRLKDTVSTKIIRHLSEIERSIHDQIQEVNFDFPAGTYLQAGKISKGENYQGLPYFVLDYPRLFSQKEVFAFRTMLWWGNQFSCTLHIGGAQIETLSKHFYSSLSNEKDMYFCVASSPWEYHFETSNYVLSSQLNDTAMLEHAYKNNFIKISRFIPVQDWNRYKSFTIESFARFLMMLK